MAIWDARVGLIVRVVPDSVMKLGRAAPELNRIDYRVTVRDSGSVVAGRV